MSSKRSKMSDFSEVELFDLYVGMRGEGPASLQIAAELEGRWRKEQAEVSMARSKVEDLEYFTRRAAEEKQKAAEAGDPHLARAHLRLAEQYRNRVEELGRS